MWISAEFISNASVNPRKPFCGTEQGNAEVHTPCYTHHPHHPQPVLTWKRSGSHLHANFMSSAPQLPNKLLWKQVSSAENISCSSSPDTFLPCARQTAHPLLPFLSRHVPAQLPAAAWVVMGKARRAQLGFCCCHCQISFTLTDIGYPQTLHLGVVVQS